MNITFTGGKKAGDISLLALLTQGHRIECAVCYDDGLDKIARNIHIKTYKSIYDTPYEHFRKSDLIVSICGDEIVPDKILEMTRYGGINTHPCLYKYKIKNPIEQMLKDGKTKASVGVHYMTREVDKGGVIVELFKEVSSKTECDVFKEIHPLYYEALEIALRKVSLDAKNIQR